MKLATLPRARAGEIARALESGPRDLELLVRGYRNDYE